MGNYQDGEALDQIGDVLGGLGPDAGPRAGKERQVLTTQEEFADRYHIPRGLEFCQEPPVLRFFAGKMKPKGDWGANLTRSRTTSERTDWRL